MGSVVEAGIETGLPVPVSAAALLATPRVWILEDLDTGRPFTINRLASVHRLTWASHTAASRNRWKHHAINAAVPLLDRVTVTVTPLHKNHRTAQDPGACAPEAKAAVDGLRDAGVLVDDTGRYVASILFLPPEIVGHDGLRIRIEEVPPT